MTQQLKDKVAIVTGASRGVGLATAKLLHAQGATVIMTDINAVDGEQAQQSIGEGSLFVQQDVSQEAGWISLIELAEREFGRLNILVNNAAILKMGDIKTATFADWKQLQSVNADSVFLSMKYAMPLMEKTGGSIVNMSSSSAVVGMPMFPAYSATKAAVRGLTQSVAVYCHQQQKGVRCNTIHPDGIATPMAPELFKDQPMIDMAKAEQAASYMCEAEDVANTILFLASDASRKINGAAINLDNSATITPPYL